MQSSRKLVQGEISLTTSGGKREDNGTSSTEEINVAFWFHFARGGGGVSP